jgi:hypothetical protein
MAKTRKPLIPLTVRLSPDTHRRLETIIRKKPHLTLNVLVNQILESELAGAKK